MVGKVKYLYRKQRYRSKDRGHPPPEYTQQEFLDWCLKSKNFQTLYKNWSDSGFKKDLAPSIDRLNDYKGYSFENIQIITWKENNDKYTRDLINRVNKKALKPVNQLCLKTGKVLFNFDCAKDASLELNIDNSHISKCCKGKLKSTGGYGWEYA